jgi:hypothetical protein
MKNYRRVAWVLVVIFGVFTLYLIHDRTRRPSWAFAIATSKGQHGLYGACPDHYPPVLTFTPDDHDPVNLTREADCSPGRDWQHRPTRFAPCPDGRMPHIARLAVPGGVTYEINCRPDRLPSVQLADNEVES